MKTKPKTVPSAAGPKDDFKYARIKTELSIQILEGQLRPHDRVPSLNEIVHKYKVSKITARRVLQDLVLEGMIYSSRGRGSFVADPVSGPPLTNSRSAARQLGVVFEHASGSFMSDIVLGIDEEAYRKGARVTLRLSNNSYEREAENLERLALQGIKRIVLFMVLQHDPAAFNPNVGLYLRLQKEGVRLLSLGCTIAGVQLPSLTWDDYGAMRQLVRFMHEKGRRQLGFICRYDNASTTTERMRGFKEGLLENSLFYAPERIVQVKIRSLETVVSDAAASAREILEAHPNLEAILCSDEMVAAGVFEVLEASKTPRKMPILVGGIGGTRNLHVLRGNPYILLEEDTYELGAKAVGMIFDDTAADRADAKLQTCLPVPLRIPKSLKA